MSACRQKADGTVVVTVRLTLKPGRDDALIALVQAAPRRGLAGAIREAMRSGVQSECAVSESLAEDLELALDELGFVL